MILSISGIESEGANVAMTNEETKGSEKCCLWNAHCVHACDNQGLIDS